MNPSQDAKMLFWGSVLAPILYKHPEDHRSDRQILIELTDKLFMTPDGHSRSYSLSTLKRKLKSYRAKGAQGFLPSSRSDEGRIRKNREQTLSRAVELKREVPTRSHSTINLILRSEDFDPIPTSTLLRHLRANGVTLKKLGYSKEIVRKRWSREHTHSLWVGDFAQGPDIIDAEGQRQKTWISAFIDTHSRFLVTGIYETTSDIQALTKSLLAAFSQHGVPRSIYVDNAKVYRGGVLARACLDLGIELIHRTVRDPQGGGLIERFFLTAQRQFELEFSKDHKIPKTLDKLNELFELWVEEVYHRTDHSETKCSPVERYERGLLSPISPIRPEVASTSFYQQWTRTVHGDFCDVSLNNRLYRCDTTLRGDKVLLRCPLGIVPEALDVYDLKGKKKIGVAHLHDRSQREIPAPPPLPQETVSIEDVLKKINQQRMEREMLSLPPVHIGEAKKTWSLEEFIDNIAQLVGCELENLAQHDLVTLSAIHQKQSLLCLKKLKKIWGRCEPQTLNQLILDLAKKEDQ